MDITKPRINLENSTDAITSAPLLTTTAVSSITSSSASSGGNVTDDGAVDVTARGVCWSPSADPTTGDSCTTDGTGTGSFTSAVTGLIPNAVYHVRAYATNSIGKSLVIFYYKYSPPMADYISRHDSLRAIVRIFLLPVVGMSWIALKFGPASTLGLLLLLFALMSATGLIFLRKIHLRRHRN